MDLEQQLGSAPQAAPDLKGYDRTVSDNAIDDELVGGSLCDHLVCSLERDAVALAHHEGGKFLEAAMISRARFLLIAGVALVPLASVGSAGIFSTGEARS
jgi:hypothetical protein